MEVICSRAGDCKEQDCIHRKPHAHKQEYCSFEGCGATGWGVECIPVANEHQELVQKLKDQIYRTENTSVVEDYNFDRRVKENQILIMEALAVLLEAK